MYKGLGFYDADEMKDLVALVRVLAAPESDLRAAAFLRSGFVGISDERSGVSPLISRHGLSLPGEARSRIAVATMSRR